MPRGQPRKPTELKKRQGTYNTTLANHNEPTPLKGVPCMPDSFDADLREAWDFFTPELLAMGVLTVADGAALEALCKARVVYIAAVNHAIEVEKYHPGFVHVEETDRGAIVTRKHPAFALQKEAAADYRAWLNEFGLTPAARSRVAVVKKEAEGEFVEFKDH